MLVLDANIPIRAVLGLRVRTLLARYGAVEFFAPDTAYEEAREHLPKILTKRHIALMLRFHSSNRLRRSSNQ